MLENIAASTIEVSGDILTAADALINYQTVKGPRYPAAAQGDIDTEEF